MRIWPGLLLALVMAGAGCNQTKVQDFTPGASNARAALETGLRSWKDGKRPGMVVGAAKPAVQAEDFEWTAGQKLLEYEIVTEEPPAATGPRVFHVRLKTDKGQREVKYMVIGIDPMLVFRDADFDKLSGGTK